MTRPLELWVGPECTVVRIGRRWRDQLEATGFASRPGDLDRLASIGARRMRFPLLWERTAPRAPDEMDWRWSDEALRRLDERGLPVIMGLLHHGSGPHYTSLTDRRFPRLFADYARRVAQRHPERTWWTPINEPLTTARFSGLYGVWYPHRRDDRGFVRALLQEVKATVLAMREIRRVNPQAELIQTDDLGYTRCTPTLATQAEFDNERRWLSFDLLAGRVDRSHPMWDFLIASGAGERELLELCDAPCPADVLGINTYVTSERFLDERLELHPPSLYGGNGHDVYVDIETVRAHGSLIDGFGARLREAHARYGRPVAITEVHMGCTRDEQLRWFAQAWDAACAARRDGVDVQGVTAWATFGCVDWSSLLVRDQGHYEPGLWDVRADPPRLTALGRLARRLAAGGTTESAPEEAATAAEKQPADDRALDAILGGPGWWQRELRLRVPAYGPVQALPPRGGCLLITGSGGALAWAFARLAHLRGLPYELLTRSDMDIADPVSVEAALERHAPWAVVNTSGVGRIDAAENDPSQWRENAEGPAVLAAACARRGIRLLGFSSDLVFAGDRAAPYLERDAPRPLNAYGRAKAHAERGILAAAPDALVVRSAAFFGPWDERNFVTRGLAAIRGGSPWRAASDQVVSPTYLPDLVHASLDLLIDGERGLWHLTNGQPTSWADFACRVCEQAGLPRRGVVHSPGAALGQLAPRPAYSALGSERATLLPTLEDALRRYLVELEPASPPPPRLQVAA